MGAALVVEREVVPVFRVLLPEIAVEGEAARLQGAVEGSRRQIQAIKDRLAREGGGPHAYIFDAQLLMLEDPLLLARSLAILRRDRVNAEWALRVVSEQLHALFAGMRDDTESKAHPEDYQQKLAAAIAISASLEAAVKADDGAAADQQLAALTRSCKACHVVWRDK